MAAAAAQQMHWDQNQNYMMMKKEFEKSFRQATTQLDLQANESQNMIARGIRKDEYDLFVEHNMKETKQLLLERRNAKMDEYIMHTTEYGGRPITKQEEPMNAPAETPLIVEMRMMHMDFVEESFAKRALALKLALECQHVAIAKARIRLKKKREL